MMRRMPLGTNDLLVTMAKIGATDLALIPSVVPRMRVAKVWRPLDVPPLKFTDVRGYAEQLIALVPEVEFDSPKYRDRVQNARGPGSTPHNQPLLWTGPGGVVCAG